MRPQSRPWWPMARRLPADLPRRPASKPSQTPTHLHSPLWYEQPCEQMGVQGRKGGQRQEISHPPPLQPRPPPPAQPGSPPPLPPLLSPFPDSIYSPSRCWSCTQCTCCCRAPTPADRSPGRLAVSCAATNQSPLAAAGLRQAAAARRTFFLLKALFSLTCRRQETCGENTQWSANSRFHGPTAICNCWRPPLLSLRPPRPGAPCALRSPWCWTPHPSTCPALRAARQQGVPGADYVQFRCQASRQESRERGRRQRRRRRQWW